MNVLSPCPASTCLPRGIRRIASRAWLAGLGGLAILLGAWGMPGASRASAADTIYFKHGTMLEGKVEETSPNRVVLTLGQGEGRLVLDWSTIERIEYDYESRLAKLAPDDWAGHYHLGLWAERMVGSDPSMPRRALRQFLRVLDKANTPKPGVPKEVLLHGARMFEAVTPPQPGQAKAFYQRYLQVAPDDEEAKAALKRLAETDPEKADALPPEPPREPDGLEALVNVPGGGTREAQWKHASWSRKGEARLVQDSANRDNLVLELGYRSLSKDKAAFQVNINENLADKQAVVMDVYNPDDPDLRIAIALVVRRNNIWYETKRTYPVPAGQWSKDLRIPLNEPPWKAYQGSQALRDLNQPKPEDLKETRSFLILLFNKKTQGNVYFDSIRFE